MKSVVDMFDIIHGIVFCWMFSVMTIMGISDFILPSPITEFSVLYISFLFCWFFMTELTIISYSVKNISEYFKNIEKAKDIPVKEPTEREDRVKYIESLLTYIMNNKKVKTITPVRECLVELEFTDKTKLEIWVANKYYGFMSKGTYWGKDGNTIEWSTSLNQQFVKDFEKWFIKSKDENKFEFESRKIAPKYEKKEEKPAENNYNFS